MTRDEVLEICAAFPGAVEDYPFGDGVAVFKVGSGGRATPAVASVGASPGNGSHAIRGFRNGAGSAIVMA